MRKMNLLVVVSFVTLCWASLASAADFSKATPGLLEKGKAAFTTNCVLCHGEKGDGTGPAAAAMNPKPRNFAKEKFKKGEKPAEVFNTITKGLEGTSMASFAHLPEEERWALAHHVLTLKKAK